MCTHCIQVCENGASFVNNLTREIKPWSDRAWQIHINHFQFCAFFGTRDQPQSHPTWLIHCYFCTQSHQKKQTLLMPERSNPTCMPWAADPAPPLCASEGLAKDQKGAGTWPLVAASTSGPPTSTSCSPDPALLPPQADELLVTMPAELLPAQVVGLLSAQGAGRLADVAAAVLMAMPAGLLPSQAPGLLADVAAALLMAMPAELLLAELRVSVVWDAKGAGGRGCRELCRARRQAACAARSMRMPRSWPSYLHLAGEHAQVSGCTM
jgi:hypothetical protein